MINKKKLANLFTGEITFQNNQAEINIDELPVEKMVDSNHGGTVSPLN